MTDTPLRGAEAASSAPRPAECGESLFERFPWLYAFCRDHLFRDDTLLISSSLWPTGTPGDSCRLLELGCGPGFYARRLAKTFKQLQVVGLDRSERQLHRARHLARASRLGNCRFVNGDALAVPMPEASFDALVVSRLFAVLHERERTLAEMYRVLKPGGRCFMAEPRSALRAAVPLRAMWLLARWTAFFSLRERPGRYLEPRMVSVMSVSEFGALVESQPWKHVRCWRDGWYQYAVCEKGTE